MLSPRLVPLMTLRGKLREYVIFIYFMCWAEFTFHTFSIKACYQTAYAFCFLNIIFIFVVWETSILILALTNFTYFHFFYSASNPSYTLIYLILIWRKILVLDTEDRFLVDIVSFMSCRDACTFLCLSYKNMSQLIIYESTYHVHILYPSWHIDL